MGLRVVTTPAPCLKNRMPHRHAGHVPLTHQIPVVDTDTANKVSALTGVSHRGQDHCFTAGAVHGTTHGQH